MATLHALILPRREPTSPYAAFPPKATIIAKIVTESLIRPDSSRPGTGPLLGSLIGKEDQEYVKAQLAD